MNNNTFKVEEENNKRFKTCGESKGVNNQNYGELSKGQMKIPSQTIGEEKS